MRTDNTESPARPIRILLFSSLFPHEGEPTLGIFVRNRLQHLMADEKVEAIVVAPVPWFPLQWKVFGRYGRAAGASRVSQVDGLTVYHPRFLVFPKIGMRLTPAFLAFSARRLIRRLLKQGHAFDLLDAHYLFPDGVAAARIAREFELPFVVTARGSDVTQIARMTGPRTRVLESCKAAGHVITVSQSLKDLLVGMGLSANHVSSLRNGVDCDRFQPIEGARGTVCLDAGLNPDLPIVLFAGWLIRRKRVDIVLDALSQMPGVQAVIVGDGDLRSKLEIQTQALKLEDRVVFVGQKSPDDMPTYFSAADVLCLPSEREGWANVMLEAMACGTPVVARAVDGALELIRDKETGRLVKGEDPADYARALTAVIGDSSRDRVRQYAEGFDWQATSKAQVGIFRKVIDDHITEKRLGGNV